MDIINVLEFKLLDPVKAGEPWAVERDSPCMAVEIIIDGVRILDVIREVEMPYLQEEGKLDLQDGGHDYGHLAPKYLHDSLLSATVEGSYEYDCGVHLFCCGGCGEPGCWFVTFRVKEDEKFACWCDFQHNHRPWAYDLHYRFEKQAYQAELNKLRDMASCQTVD